MKISVITIAFNDRPGLSRTIESVQRQDGVELEHIVVDGGSSDGTPELLAGIETPLTWVSERDNGRYDAMNKGAAMATGDLLWFMNSADIFHSARSASFVANEYFKQPFEWGYGLSRIVEDGKSIGVAGRVPFEHARFLIGGHVIPHQAAVFERDFFLKLGGYSDNFGLTADQEFMMRASLEARPEVWAEVLCDFDASGAGSTRNAWAHYKDMMRARSVAGIQVTKSALADNAISVFFCGFTILERLLRRPLRKASPVLVGGKNK